MSPTRRGVLPGSFNPPTFAHLAISEAARDQHRLDAVVWSVSRVALAKEHVDVPRFEHRVAVLEQVAADIGWLSVAVTNAQLLSDVAAGFDVLVMGADKWHQIHDVRFYDNDARRRDASVAALPVVAIAARGDLVVPPELALCLDGDHDEVSSTAARTGHSHLMLPAAAQFDERTGAWSDVGRYRRWIAENQN